jgi:hypothetical protein
MSIAITSVVFNQGGAYNAGDTIQMTVDYTETDFTPGPDQPAQDTVNVTVANAAAATATADAQTITITSAGGPVPSTPTVTVTDSGGRTWTVTSNTQVGPTADDGSSVWEAVVTAVA